MENKRVTSNDSDWFKSYEHKGLEILLAVLIIPSLAIALFFLSGNITGNAVANISNETSFSIGGISFLVGLVLSFFYFRIKI